MGTDNTSNALLSDIVWVDENPDVASAGKEEEKVPEEKPASTGKARAENRQLNNGQLDNGQADVNQAGNRQADNGQADNGQHEFYSISELSREFDVTLRALRFYESKALLTPQREGQSRLYSEQDRARLALILRGKRLGFTLGEIQDMVEISERRAEPGALNLSREKCHEQISLLETRKREIEEALAELRSIYSSFYAPAGEDVTHRSPK